MVLLVLGSLVSFASVMINKAMKKLLLATLLSIASLANAAEPLWIYVTKSDTDLFYIKRQSVELIKTDGGKPAVLALGLVKDNTKNTSTFVVWYVELTACNREFGKLNIADSEGTLKGSTDFAFGQGSIASILGEVLCSSAERQIKFLEQQKLNQKQLGSPT